MEQGTTEIEINGIKYVPKNWAESHGLAEKLDGLEYVIVRTYSAGVFAGSPLSGNRRQPTRTGKTLISICFG